MSCSLTAVARAGTAKMGHSARRSSCRVTPNIRRPRRVRWRAATITRSACDDLDQGQHAFDDGFSIREQIEGAECIVESTQRRHIASGRHDQRRALRAAKDVFGDPAKRGTLWTTYEEGL